MQATAPVIIPSARLRQLRKAIRDPDADAKLLYVFNGKCRKVIVDRYKADATTLMPTLVIAPLLSFQHHFSNAVVNRFLLNATDKNTAHLI